MFCVCLYRVRLPLAVHAKQQPCPSWSIKNTVPYLSLGWILAWNCSAFSCVYICVAIAYQHHTLSNVKNFARNHEIDLINYCEFFFFFLCIFLVGNLTLVWFNMKILIKIQLWICYLYCFRGFIFLEYLSKHVKKSILALKIFFRWLYP